VTEFLSSLVKAPVAETPRNLRGPFAFLAEFGFARSSQLVRDSKCGPLSECRRMMVSEVTKK
jgi:hypothetical protein